MSRATQFADMPVKARICVAAFAIAGIVELLAALWSGPSAKGGLFFVMLGLGVITSRAKVKILGGSTLSLLTSVVLATVMLLGTKVAIVVSMTGVVVQAAFPWKRRVPYRMFFNMGMVGVTVALAGTGYHTIVHSAHPAAMDQIAGILAASFIYYICNSTFVSLIVSLSTGNSIWKLWHESFLYTAPVFLLEGLVSFTALRLASFIQFGVLAAVVPMLALTYYSIRVYLYSLEREKKHAAEMSELNETLERRVVERSESLRIAKDLAEEASRAKSAFLANMSHELRTPLNAIIGYSEMLEEDAIDSGQTEPVEDLEKIQVAAKHLLSLINDLLDISKIEAGKMQIHLEPFDLAEVLQEVVTTVEPLAMKNGNKLKATCDRSVPLVSDRTKICQVLINLASNGCKFTEHGTISIDVIPEPEQNRIHIRIADTGIGMHADLLERLFKPFVQGDSSSTRRFSGTGLGLAISRNFCRLLGGDISVSSVPGEGSLFEIDLPMRLATAECIEAPEPVLAKS